MLTLFDKPGHWLTVIREQGDKPIYNESLLWFKIKQRLNTAGHGPLIKKCPGKDGHLTSAPYYLRSRKRGPKEIAIHDPNYAIRDMAKYFREEGALSLRIEYEIT